MSDDNVRSLAAVRADKGHDNRLWTPADCLEEALRDLLSGKMKADKLAVVFLDTEDMGFTPNYYLANLKSSELLALLECAKAKALRDMGFNEP